MIDVTEAVKDLFRDGQSHNYSMTIEVGTSMYFTTPILTITDDDIKNESAELKDSLFSGDKVQFGTVLSAQFTCTLIGVDTELKGKYIKVTLTYDDNDIPYGRYYVESYEKTAYSHERKIIAYDYAYFLNVVDPNPMRYATGSQHGSNNTAIKICHFIFDHLGLQYTPFTSEDSYTYVPLISNETTYTDMLQWMGELYAGWWKCDRTGTFKFIQIDNTVTPETISAIRPKSCEHSGATLGAYTGVRLHGWFILQGDSVPKTQFYLYGQEGNVYEMKQLSPMCYGKSKTWCDTLGAKLLAAYNAVSYIPHRVQWDGRPYMECGDLYTFETDDDTSVKMTITAPLIMYGIKGIGGLKETVETGGSSYQSTTNSTAIKTERSTISNNSSATSMLAEQTSETVMRILTPQLKSEDSIADGNSSTVLLFGFTITGFEPVPVILHSMIETTVVTTVDEVSDPNEYNDCVITATLYLDDTLQKTWQWSYGDGKHILNVDVLLEEVAVGSHTLTLNLAPSGGSLT